MDLRQLECLLAVAQEGSFTRAAERLFVTQSGASALVRRLENELGHQLLVRGRRAVTLTDVGRTVVEYARAMLDARDALLAAVDEHDDLLRGRVAYGTVSSGPPTTMLVDSFLARHPEVELEIVERSSAEVLEAVRAGRLDLGAVGLGPWEPAGLVTDVMGDTEIVAVVPPTHRLGERATVCVADLDGEPMLCMPEGAVSRSLIEQIWRADGLTPRVVVSSPDTATLVGHARDGRGVAVVPEVFLGARDGLRILRFGDPRMRVRLAVVRRPDAAGPAARAFHAHVVAGMRRQFDRATGG